MVTNELRASDPYLIAWQLPAIELAYVGVRHFSTRFRVNNSKGLRQVLPTLVPLRSVRASALAAAGLVEERSKPEHVLLFEVNCSHLFGPNLYLVCWVS